MTEGGLVGMTGRELAEITGKGLASSPFSLSRN